MIGLGWLKEATRVLTRPDICSSWRPGALGVGIIGTVWDGAWALSLDDWLFLWVLCNLK